MLPDIVFGVFMERAPGSITQFIGNAKFNEKDYTIFKMASDAAMEVLMKNGVTYLYIEDKDK